MREIVMYIYQDAKLLKEAHFSVVHQRAVEEFFLEQHARELAVSCCGSWNGNHVRIALGAVVPIDGHTRLTVYVHARAPVGANEHE